MTDRHLRVSALAAASLLLLLVLHSRLESLPVFAAAQAGAAAQTALAGDNELNHLFLPLLANGALEPQSASRLVLAEHGGTLQLDNITLMLPPGALSQNTLITLSKPQYDSTLGEEGMELVKVDPSGQALLIPATLTIRYDDSVDERFLNVAALDEATGEWVHYPISRRDPAQNTVSVTITHFSLYAIYSDEPLYLVLDIPAQFLQPGDLLFSMAPDCDTGVAYWMAGYTAIYSETVPFGSGKSDIIEAAPFGDVRLSCPAPGGVREWTLANFAGRSCNFYMGARRLPLASAGQAKAARDFAARQIGKGYLRLDQRVAGERAANCYSCAGLVENAYQVAGADLTPTNEQLRLLTPLQLFEQTAPVSEITVSAGQPVRIPVRGVVKVQQPSSADHYQLGGTIWGSNLPHGSRLRDGIFEWTPQVDDEGRTFTFAITVSATVGDQQHTVTQPFTIIVRPAQPINPTVTPSPSPTPVTPTPVTPTPVTPTPTPTNRPPAVPANPSPADGAAEQRTNVKLSWHGSDPDGDTVSYAVYLSAGSNPPTKLVASNLKNPELDPGALAYGTTYFWRVVASDAQGATTAGPVWRFSTMAPLPVNNYTPIWSPDGKRLLFVSYTAGNGDLYVMELAGGQLTRLTDHPADDYAPAWSPDGSKIAFWSERDGNGEVYLIDADGSDLTNVTNNPANDAFDGISAWSPDGRSLVFMSNRDGNSEIYRVNADGTTVLNLTHHGAEDYAPAWSPDGSKILFLSDRDGNVEIYSMNADGSNPVNLTKNAANDYDPVWSPDGSKIAFGSNRDGNSEIYVMNASGGNPANLTQRSSNEFYPVWSPDGKAIAFWTNRDGNGEIYLMTAGGANPINLTNHMASDHRPRWSPDGAKLAFERWQTGISDVWVMNADGSQQMSLQQLLTPTSEVAR